MSFIVRLLSCKLHRKTRLKKSGSHLNNPPTQLFCIKLGRDSAPAWNALGLAPNPAGLYHWVDTRLTQGWDASSQSTRGFSPAEKWIRLRPVRSHQTVAPRDLEDPSRQGLGVQGVWWCQGGWLTQRGEDALRHLLFLPEFLDSQERNRRAHHVPTPSHLY